MAHYRCSTEFCKGPHQGRGGLVGVGLFTLTFDSSPIKGEGDWLCRLVVTPPCGFCIKSRMTMLCIVTPIHAYPYVSMSVPRPVVSRLRGNDGVKTRSDGAVRYYPASSSSKVQAPRPRMKVSCMTFM